MIEVLVTSAGLLIGHADLVWVRAHDPQDRIAWELYDFLDSVESPTGGWLYFAGSECFEWNEGEYGCLASGTQFSLVNGVQYDLVAWSEPEDIRDPERDLVPIAEQWSFQPGDISMDGIVDCGDMQVFASMLYDWNLDGSVTSGDVEELLIAMVAARADFDGDGVVGELDFTEFFTDFGCTSGPDAPCRGDLDCNGRTGTSDLLLLMMSCGL